MIFFQVLFEATEANGKDRAASLTKKIRKNFTYRQTQLRSLKTRKVYDNYDPDKS